jgi:ABC-type glycerol-3-phosphate transport system substrate-binding protein
MDAAGITKPPETFEELRAATIALNHPPERYGFGLNGRQGPAMFSSFSPWLYSAGGDTVDFKTGEILINKPEAIFALEYWTDFVRKDKVVPPEAMTWDFEEIVAGGQSDRYAIVETFAPYGTLINDPKLSKSGGKWVWDTVPGRTDKSQSKTWVDGHFLGIPKYTKNKEWSLEFIRMACSKQFMKQSMIRGNAPPRGSVLRDPEMVKLIGWTDVAARAIETGVPTPAQPIFPTLGLSLRAGLSQALIGDKTPKQALDDVAADWQRAMRRMGNAR